jgi:thioredoxin reductase (NADPH)
MRTEEVMIIGAGPAGLSSAIQLKRSRIPFVLLERERVGGLLWNANLVENYPGFPKGVKGPKLVKLLEKQMEHIGVEVTFDTALSLTHDGFSFRVTGTHAEYQSRCVVVASGTRPNQVPIVIPEALAGRVFSEVSPLLGEHGRHIVIVGAGDAAFDYALNLTKNRNSVTILNRGKHVQCLGLLWERAQAEPSIIYTPEISVHGVAVAEGSGMLELQLGQGARLTADYLLFAIGRSPQVDFLPEELASEQVDGLYFIGDVKNGLYRQAAIAAGDGLRAAMDIYFKFKVERKSR